MTVEGYWPIYVTALGEQITAMTAVSDQSTDKTPQGLLSNDVTALGD